MFPGAPGRQNDVPTYQVESERTGAQEEGYLPDLVPEVAADLAWGQLVSRESVEDEIDLMLRTVRGFWSMQPDQVMLACSAMTARCTELGVHLHRLEGKREWRQIRTMQVERLLLEFDRQWRTASRLIEVRRQDINLSGSQA